MFKRLLLFAISVIHITNTLSAQDYSAALIPDSLIGNAHLVIRKYTVDYDVQSFKSVIERIKKVITVLDQEGEKKAYLSILYDKNSSVFINYIILYDRNGKKIKNIKLSDVKDSPAYSSFELYSDTRSRFYSPGYAEYPYTIEYDYNITFTNIISFGYWRPISDYDISLQYARLSFRHNPSFKINKKVINFPTYSFMEQISSMMETWSIVNLKAIEDEPFDISISERIPGIYLMPAVLNYDKYEGSANNWTEFGKWVYSLYQDRDEISDAEKIKIESLLKEVPDTLGRIGALYKYMQDNTRYVAITLGIGGFQPFDAKTVFETGYGDCKALSNYMCSLLKSVGIKSFPALVASGSYKEPIFIDFPNFQQFDHVILCVPYRKDTIWLECTDQKIPFGFLNDFTDDRDVLLITENGGKFARTCRYKAADNIRICNSEFTIDSTGKATCSINTLFKGLQYGNISGFLSLNYDEQKKWLLSNSTLPSLQLKSFSISNSKKTLPFAIINESSVSGNYCSFSGKYMLLPLNLLNVQKPIQKMTKPRKSDILINRSFVDYDTLVFKMPKNYKLESIPDGSTFNSNFGNYSYSVSANENEIIYTRKFGLNEGRYKPGEYKNLYDFILSVSKADNIKILLTKK